MGTLSNSVGLVVDRVTNITPTATANDLIYLAKAIEALSIDTSINDIVAATDDEIARINLEYDSFAKLTGAVFTGDVSGTNVTLTGTLSAETVSVGSAQATYTSATDTLDFDKGITVPGFTATGIALLQGIKETVTIDATGVDTAHTLNVNNGVVVTNTVAAVSDWTVNIQGDSATTLDSLMAVGESMTVTHLVTQGETAFVNTSVLVDGVTVTPKWQGGSAPTAGTASGVDAYTYTLIKTGAASFSVFASQTVFG